METEGWQDQEQNWRDKLSDNLGLAALTATMGVIMACLYAVEALGAFRAGMPVHAWVIVINAVVLSLLFPGAMLVLGINRLWGFAGTGLAFGVAGGSVISVSALDHFTAGDPAMGAITAVMAGAIVLGMPAMAALVWKGTQ